MIVADLTACKHFSGMFGNAPVIGGTVGQMSLARCGNASQAFVVSCI